MMDALASASRAEMGEWQSERRNSREALLPVPVGDAAARMVMVTHFVSWLETNACPGAEPELALAGLTPQLVDRIRALSVSDALRLAAGPCGLTISVDCAQMQQQLLRIERQRGERGQYEALIAAGASPALISRLFAVSVIEVRRRRKLIAPHAAVGGRPRLPGHAEREDVRACWIELQADSDRSERERYLALAERFPAYPLVALEDVIADLVQEPPRHAS